MGRFEFLAPRHRAFSTRSLFSSYKRGVLKLCLGEGDGCKVKIAEQLLTTGNKFVDTINLSVSQVVHQHNAAVWQSYWH